MAGKVLLMGDFSDVSAKLKQKRTAQAGFGAPAERDFTELHLVRGRILGVLLRDARSAMGKSQAEVAAAVGVEEQRLQTWEFGDESPSLPQLEMIAYFLDVPVSQFWGTEIIGENKERRGLPVPTESYNQLRDRVIGVRLAVARKEAKLSREELAKESGSTPELIEAYEMGQRAIPFPQLATIAAEVKKSITYFLEETGRIGAWLRLQEEYDRFTELPEALRAFVSLPVNQPYLEIALRLSKMPLGELRLVAEKILDITL